MTKVSWQPPFSQRLTGYLMRFDSDGAKVRRGARIDTVAPGDLTFEMP
jgi:hypothetical protein